MLENAVVGVDYYIYSKSVKFYHKKGFPRLPFINKLKAKDRDVQLLHKKSGRSKLSRKNAAGVIQ